jgi:hypothetical protein
MRNSRQPPQPQQVVQGAVALDSPGTFGRSSILSEKLLVEPLRQHPQDLYRVVWVVLMYWLSTHSSQASAGLRHTGLTTRFSIPAMEIRCISSGRLYSGWPKACVRMFRVWPLPVVGVSAPWRGFEQGHQLCVEGQRFRR